MIEPYDETFNEKTIEERREWSRKIAQNCVCSVRPEPRSYFWRARNIVSSLRRLLGISVAMLKFRWKALQSASSCTGCRNVGDGQRHAITRAAGRARGSDNLFDRHHAGDYR